jgi:23S rRNA (adenine2503-C2)-methyltransferase
MQNQPYIFDLDPEQLSQLLPEWGMPRFRATQILQWVYRHQVADPAQMTNLSMPDRRTLAEKIRFLRSNPVQHQLAGDHVQKLLLQWDDRADTENTTPQTPALTTIHSTQHDPARQTECVVIPALETQSPRKTACVSSQIGCPVGCRFCASGLGGLDGNLTGGQIVEQVWRLATLPDIGRISHVVFMGMGEPLANFEHVVHALRTLTADWGCHISARHITVSTVGLPAQIRRLAEIDLPITLAISLHAPNDTIRRRLIPWAEFVTIEQLMDAGRHYFDRTGREVTLEYTLLRDINDRPEHARELAAVAKKLRGHVNLIRYNEVKTIPFNRPDSQDVLRFQSALRTAGVKTFIRASRGRDIAAACGQLRHEHPITPLKPSPSQPPLASRSSTPLRSDPK